MAESQDKAQRVSLNENKAAHDLKVRSGFVKNDSGTGAVPNGESIMPITGKVAKLGLSQGSAKKYLTKSRLKRRRSIPLS